MGGFESVLDRRAWNEIRKEIYREFRADSVGEVQKRGNVFLKYGLNLMEKPTRGVIFSLKFEIFCEKVLGFLEDENREKIVEYGMDKRYERGFLDFKDETRKAISIIQPIVKRHFIKSLKLENDFIEAFRNGMKRLGVGGSFKNMKEVLRRLSGTPFFSMEMKKFQAPLGLEYIVEPFRENNVRLARAEIYPTLPAEVKFHEKSVKWYDHGDVSCFKIASPVFIYFAETEPTVFVSAIERNKIVNGVSPKFKEAFTKDQLELLSDLEKHLQFLAVSSEEIKEFAKERELKAPYMLPEDVVDAALLKKEYVAKRMSGILNGDKSREAALDIERFHYINYVMQYFALLFYSAKVKDGRPRATEKRVNLYNGINKALVVARVLLSKTEAMKGYSLAVFLPLFSLMVPKKKLIIPTPYFREKNEFSFGLAKVDSIRRDLEEYSHMKELFGGKKRKRQMLYERITSYGHYLIKRSFKHKFGWQIERKVKDVYEWDLK